jgi:hypothetical protein
MKVEIVGVGAVGGAAAMAIALCARSCRAADLAIRGETTDHHRRQLVQVGTFVVERADRDAIGEDAGTLLSRLRDKGER